MKKGESRFCFKSKRGNRNLRKVMHFPALAAIRTDERFRDIFLRIV
ncbi:transposase, partial [Sphingobacterium multivorum]